MPSLFKFLFVVGTIVGVGYGSLYALATYFPPQQKEVATPIYGVKVRK
jgi:hypothetical protein